MVKSIVFLDFIEGEVLEFNHFPSAIFDPGTFMYSTAYSPNTHNAHWYKIMPISALQNSMAVLVPKWKPIQDWEVPAELKTRVLLFT